MQVHTTIYDFLLLNHMLNCVMALTPPTPLEREMSALTATPLFWGRVVVPEFSCRVFIMEDQFQIQTGLRGICGS
jgi:hypothetical protein